MYIGIDVGGTNLKAGAVTAEGKILATANRKACACATGSSLVAMMAELAREVTQRAGCVPGDVERVGIGVPGALDREHGVVLASVNAPLRGVEVSRQFRSHWDVSVTLENDANCAAVGEYLAGGTRGSASSILLTLGTGVGGGYIRNGMLQPIGMEVGHMVVVVGGVSCACGRRGCWEQYASARALKRMTREAMQAHPQSRLWGLCGGSHEGVRGRTSFDAARLGDETACAVTSSYIEYLAEGISNLVNLFQPEVICLGGGVSNERDEDFLFPLRRRVDEFSCTQVGGLHTEITRAVLGNSAGIIGAALLTEEICGR